MTRRGEGAGSALGRAGAAGLLRAPLPNCSTQQVNDQAVHAAVLACRPARQLVMQVRREPEQFLDRLSHDLSVKHVAHSSLTMIYSVV